MTFNLNDTHDAQYDEGEALYAALVNFFTGSPGTVYCRRVGEPIRAVVASDYESFKLDDVPPVQIQGSPLPHRFVSLHDSRMMTDFLKDELQIVYEVRDRVITAVEPDDGKPGSLPLKIGGKFKINFPSFPGVQLSRPLLPGDVELTITEC